MGVNDGAFRDAAREIAGALRSAGQRMAEAHVFAAVYAAHMEHGSVSDAEDRATSAMGKFRRNQ